MIGALRDITAVASGGIVGFSLGLIGGGGSVLAVPLLVYVVGMPSVHAAIGTSAVAVTTSAALSLAGHAYARNVRWSCAIVFAIAGMLGAAGGAQLGKMVDGTRLLSLFGLLMIVIGLSMLRPRTTASDADVRLDRSTIARLLPFLIGIGFLVGLLSGFFGIGGGFLVVPGLIGATAMPLLDAVGSSLGSRRSARPPPRATPCRTSSTGRSQGSSYWAAPLAVLRACSPRGGSAAASGRSTMCSRPSSSRPASMSSPEA